MGAMPSMAGALLKLTRADAQIESLRHELLSVLSAHEAEDWLAVKKDTYEGNAALTLYVTDLPGFPPEISVTIGEIVHNLRSSLDHVAWALVPGIAMRELTASGKRRVAFPMVERRWGRQGFWERPGKASRNVRGRLPGVPQEALRFIEGYQPYRRSTAGRAIRALQSLSNTDKHRTIIPTLFYPTKFSFNLTYSGAKQLQRVTRLRPGREMRLGSGLLTWTFSRPPNKGSG